MIEQTSEVLPTPSSSSQKYNRRRLLIVWYCSSQVQLFPKLILLFKAIQLSLELITNRSNRRMSDYFPCVNLVDTEAVRSAFNLVGAEKTSIIVYGPIMLLISIFNLSALIGVKAFRQPPSDILIFTNLFSVLKLLVIYCTMIYDDIYPVTSSPQKFQSFCIGVGFLDVFAEIAKGLYTLVFGIYYTRKVRNPLKTWSGHNKQLHFTCLISVLLITFAIYLSGSIGMTPFGYCGILFTKKSFFVDGSLQIFYTLILIVSSLVFLRYIRKIENNNNRSRSYFRYYFCFLGIYCANEVMIVTSHFIVAVTCTQQINPEMFYNARIIETCCSGITPFFVLAIVLSNDENRSIAFFQLFKKLLDKYRKWRKNRAIEKRKKLAEERHSYCEQLMNYRDSFQIELARISDGEGYISQLKNSNRASLLLTILGCLSIHHLELKNYVSLGLHLRTSAVQEDKQTLFQWNYTQTSSFSLTKALVEFYQTLFIPNVETMLVQFKAYVPNILNQFIEIDGAKRVGQSLAPNSNYQQIVNDSLNNQQSGGRSGQFFFFNSDRSLILKTLPSRQREIFIERIESFHNYLKKNTRSLIVKFYSVFSVHLPQLEEDYDFILMSNILKKIERKYVLRTYDLKGSTHSRQVLKSAAVIEDQIRITLKDVDFQKLQNKIFVSPEDRQLLFSQIQSDSQFLMNQGLIDYSLIIMKIDLKRFIEEKQNSKEMMEGVNCFCSTKQEGLAYVMGIIDYLQTWNLRKKGEKWYKSFFTKTEKISAQDPIFYSTRFVDFCKKILFPS